ncbi:MAG: hypothetical protein ACREYC_09305 [Gammaproteobacteria bacterium]
MDVGTGSGTKTLEFAAALAARVGKLRVDLLMVDPLFVEAPYLLNNLLESARKVIGNVKSESGTLEQVLAGKRCAEIGGTNLITAVHLLYSMSLIGPMLRLAQCCQVSQRFVLFAVCEGFGSDFQKIRAVLAEKGLRVPRSVLDDFSENLQEMDIVTERHAIGRQSCQIDRDRMFKDDGYWLFPFLLGCTRDEFLSSDPKVRNTVLRITREYVAELPSHVLDVPDSAIIATTGTGAPRTTV